MTAHGRTIMTAVQAQVCPGGAYPIDDSATVHHLYETASRELLAARETIRQLTEALDTSRDIGAATGILMSQFGVTQEQAFDLLRRVSQNRNIKLRDIARDVIYTGTLDQHVR
jgi:AmiR/NasT family two-component response regulator